MCYDELPSTTGAAFMSEKGGGHELLLLLGERYFQRDKVLISINNTIYEKITSRVRHMWFARELYVANDVVATTKQRWCSSVWSQEHRGGRTADLVGPHRFNNHVCRNNFWPVSIGYGQACCISGGAQNNSARAAKVAISHRFDAPGTRRQHRKSGFCTWWLLILCSNQSRHVSCHEKLCWLKRNAKPRAFCLTNW